MVRLIISFIVELIFVIVLGSSFVEMVNSENTYISIIGIIFLLILAVASVCVGERFLKTYNESNNEK